MTEDESLKQAEAIVDASVGQRLELASTPPELREAVIDGVLARMDVIRERSREQLDHLRSPSSSRIPDAYLVHEQEVEDELQKVGAGIRTALALGGSLLSSPFEVERRYATDLSPTGIWALRSEASRVPRPATRPSAFAWSRNPIPWVGDRDAVWPPPDADALAGVRQVSGVDAELVRVEEAPYAGWIQLGFAERQRTPASRHPDVSARQVLLLAGLEASDGAVPTNSAPLSSLPAALWARPYTEIVNGLDQGKARDLIEVNSYPLAGVVRYGQKAARESGLGLHPFCLSPQLEIVALLGLRPETPAIRHVLVDERGIGLVCRQWRSFLIHDGNYEPLESAVEGADLIVRPDLYRTLESVIGSERVGLGISVSSFDDADGCD